MGRGGVGRPAQHSRGGVGRPANACVKPCTRDLRVMRPSRPAFTLIEMLVVIVIILILASLTAVGVSKVIGNQRVSNTQTAIRTIQKTLSEHWAAVVSDAKKETGLGDSFAAIDQLFGPDTSGGERDRIIWIKIRLMEAFPVSFREIQNPFFYDSRVNIIPPALRKYNASYVKALGAEKIGSHKTLTESAACLLMALSLKRNGTSLNADNMGSINVADTDGDGIPEFVDSWGSPLTFYRFPTGNKALQDSNPSGAQFADPLDPGGVLFTWVGSGRGNFESYIHPLKSPFGNASPYIVPTIVSWGPDGDIFKGIGLGLDANMAIVNAAQEADNIYSFALR